ncbi:Aste57867_10054 [Aphanomyces stellatus]|uniref:Aste57867_10054 protein n=1 Tax=Aphanomyces stellatus TaxID=120398 RepID=A0A485KQB8_9STRA|nr:hypothetical protein As57867_010015 [Aphanomyces stellatus]VFT86930.1 Aste57867_10054 [Aphanomyces stellatus]
MIQIVWIYLHTTDDQTSLVRFVVARPPLGAIFPNQDGRAHLHHPPSPPYAIADMHTQSWREAFSHILTAEYIQSYHFDRCASYRTQLDPPNPSNGRILMLAVHKELGSTHEGVVVLCVVRKSGLLARYPYELSLLYVLGGCHASASPFSGQDGHRNESERRHVLQGDAQEPLRLAVLQQAGRA